MTLPHGLELAPTSPMSSSDNVALRGYSVDMLQAQSQTGMSERHGDRPSSSTLRVQRAKLFWHNTERGGGMSPEKKNRIASDPDCFSYPFADHQHEYVAGGGASPETTSTLTDSISSRNSETINLRHDLQQTPLLSQQVNAGGMAENDDACSSYSHASVVDLPPLDDVAINALALGQKTRIRRWVGGQRITTDQKMSSKTALLKSNDPAHPPPPLPSAQSRQGFRTASVSPVRGKEPRMLPVRQNREQCSDLSSSVVRSKENCLTKSVSQRTAAHSDCSYAESFARKTQTNNMTRNRSKLRVSVNPDIDEELSARPLTVFDMVERCARALAELLDQSPVIAQRLTAGTRAYSTLFTTDEKYYFGMLVQCTVQLIQEDYERRTKYFQALSARTAAQKAVMLRTPGQRNAMLVNDFVQKRVKKKMNDLKGARNVLIGSPSNAALPRRSSSCSYVKTTLAENCSGEFNFFKFGCPKGPLAQSGSNETVDVHLPFGATLLAVLAVAARLECCIIFKRRKNRSFLDTANRRVRQSAQVCVRAQQDLSGRCFSFSMIITGSSPSRVLFKRPRLIALRRIDDYVDLVLDSKELLIDYCNSVWSRF